ncbi:MAG: aminotransferase class III-fold pyridoxal phosphate-dependent enzyme [Gemmatimonadetes bacterium]|nr:aminotransferase class III-fold pyridoxal phosphate-dependent enzyme [Gemmatimonadota bacterium]
MTAECGVLLIFDEIITLRLARGGAQAMYGITPDLTTVAKIIGGGLPVGGFGGRADVMATFDPRARGTVGHSGTFNGNAVTMAAGLAALELLTDEALDHINALGSHLRDGLQRAFDAAGVAVRDGEWVARARALSARAGARLPLRGRRERGARQAVAPGAARARLCLRRARDVRHVDGDDRRGGGRSGGGRRRRGAGDGRGRVMPVRWKNCITLAILRAGPAAG